MEHAINYYTIKVGTEKHLKIFLSEITEQAYDPQENSAYHENIIQVSKWKLTETQILEIDI